jgi:hypothetical protein
LRQDLFVGSNLPERVSREWEIVQKRPTRAFFSVLRPGAVESVVFTSVFSLRFFSPNIRTKCPVKPLPYLTMRRQTGLCKEEHLGGGLQYCAQKSVFYNSFLGSTVDLDNGYRR